ncbi:BlaI/MecI/CopY family transcriptional regulator [Hamadaea tsunoensis]|uniref:BlaI/MecI/CopY family transcriptional regulator n=1 Tax=Hamadaea tsunoensis TaxID=53368 RepID=UPI0003FAEB5D|nr:BlaI/MecI/CopY family transcriptional regulator [Hamadaea tsunoensis]
MRRPAGQLEGEVLGVLWSAPQALTASEVQEAVGGGLAYNTVHTILTRLTAKGRVRRVGPAGRSAYRPVQDAAGAAADQMRAVLDAGSDRGEILMRFVTNLSPADEAALRAALDGD